MANNLFKCDDPDLQYLVDRVNDYLTDEGDGDDILYEYADVRDLSAVELVISSLDGVYDDDIEEDHDLIIYANLLDPSIYYYVDGELRYTREFFDQIALGDYIANATWDSLYNSVFDYVDFDEED